MAIWLAFIHMHKKILNMVCAITLMTGVGTVDADMVILKSGEMFQTQRAWKENGTVNYINNGQVVRVNEADVERLIHAPGPVEAPPAPEHRTPADTHPPAEGLPLSAPSPDGDETGYLDLKWGQPPSLIKDLTQVGTDAAYGGVQQYTRKHKKKRFARALVDDIVFGFWENGLYTILVEVSNFSDFMNLKAEAFRLFDVGTRNDEDVEKYYWLDKGTDRMLAYDFDSDTGFLWMRSRALHERVRARYPD